jgi:hypothetical protein
VSRKSRAWESRHEEQADISTADNKGLRDAARIFGHSSVNDIVADMGGKNANRELAKLMLEYKDKEITEKSIKSEMRNIQRYQKRERGEGGQVTKPSKKVQAILDKIARDQKLKGGKKVKGKIKGPSSVNGYKRDERDVDMWIDHEEARRMFDAIEEDDMEAAWGVLAEAYGVSEFHAYDGASIEFFEEGE